jgi:hypothetical protein
MTLRKRSEVLVEAARAGTAVPEAAPFDEPAESPDWPELANPDGFEDFSDGTGI